MKSPRTRADRDKKQDTTDAWTVAWQALVWLATDKGGVSKDCRDGVYFTVRSERELRVRLDLGGTATGGQGR